jgi:type III secretory pathway component EscS
MLTALEPILTTMEGAITLGLVVGLVIGLLIRTQKIAFAILLLIPVAMIGYVNWWQAQHPENLTSTSALDFIFGPLWPSAGAIVGYYLGKFVRDRFSKR